MDYISHLLQQASFYIPRYCAVCEIRLRPQQKHFCGACSQEVITQFRLRQRTLTLPRSGKKRTHIYFLRWSDHSHHLTQQVIKKGKQQGQLFPLLSQLLINSWYAHQSQANQKINLHNIHSIVPSPPRYLGQEDHATALAKVMSGLLQMPIQECLRRKTSDRQKSKSRSQRMDAQFEIISHTQPPGGHCAFVDDVVTTGSTVEAADESLTQLGIVPVIVSLAYRPLSH